MRLPLVSAGRAGVLQRYRLPGAWPFSGSPDGDTPHRRSMAWTQYTVPILTDVQRELFQQAKANEPILCRRGKPKYPWWRNGRQNDPSNDFK